MASLNKDFWKNKKVLITGHTGFKGSWLSLLLNEMGAQVYGLSLEPYTQPSFFNDLKIAELISGHHIQDINEKEKTVSLVNEIQPDVVFHLAAQALVLDSYENPHYTYETNVMGTLNVLEGIRTTDSVKTAIIITTDKCYENKEWTWRYRENDPLGGYDPYSSSKACSEILTSSYYNSFLKKLGKKVATARAGNVIGGGDWADYRIVPDIVRAIKNSQTLNIRSPHAIRPWQHVLDPLTGYISLAEQISAQDNDSWNSGWNFGPPPTSEKTVSCILELAKETFPTLNVETSEGQTPHEAKYLALDSSKAQRFLNWFPKYELNQAMNITMEWYKCWLEKGDTLSITRQQIKNHLES